MTILNIVVDAAQLEKRAAQAITVLPATLDRFVQRGANEFARAEKKEAPKALTNLTNSIQVRKNHVADYSVAPTVKYAPAVNNGGRPHWAPLNPLMDWLRVTKRVTDKRQLRARAKGLQRFIAAHGTKANPFVQRTRKKMDDRVIALLREGVHAGLKQVFES
ncbi:hypothetical protein [Collimonas pratensis]|uniref:HK97 gp10 family phage protein n=1 Tax=Collimonas pratensis TaxID=279113 RepID=A0ABM5Z468_9BURK|nr:hypothetical protein [Collimonas pratensis]AMP13674.1 hypothetical protein CPter291_1400 [Collimonas pratensis]